MGERSRVEIERAPARDVSSVLQWQLDVDGRIREPISMWERFTGQHHTEARGTGWLRMIHPDDRQAVESRWHFAARTGAPQRCRAQLWDGRMGGFRRVEIRWAPLRRNDGEVREWVVTAEAPGRPDIDPGELHTGERLALALEAADLALWEWDIASGEVAFSERAADLLGARPERRLPQPVFLAVADPIDRRRVSEAIAIALDPHGPGRFDVTLTPAGAPRRCLRATGRTVFEGDDGTRHAVTVVGAFQDVSHDREREREIRRRAARQQALADLGYAALRGEDPRTLLRDALGMLTAYLDVTLAEGYRHTSKGLETVFRQQARPAGGPADVDQAASGVSVPIRTSDGSPWGALAIYSEMPRHFEEHEVSIMQSVSNVVGAAVSRAATEDELRASEARLHVALNAASIAVLHVDRSLRCEWALNLPIGVDTEALLGRRFDAFFPKAEAEAVAALHSDVLTGEAPVHRQLSLTTNGVARTYEMFAEPFRDGRGHVVGVTTAAVDVTRHIRFEGELENARSAAEQANAAKDHFLAVLSHELRNPLTAVLAAAEELSEDPDIPARRRRILQLIERNARHEKRLIDDLLDVSRLARGLVDLAHDRVDVADVLRDAVETSVREASEHGVALATELDNAGCWVVGDPQRLRQVALNLLRNAIRHTTDGTVRIRCSGDGDCVRIEFEDDGEGIDADLLPSIFQAFRRGEQAGQSAQGGLGIGLSVCKSLVERQGGTIEAISEGPGRGSKFVIRLPRAVDQRPSQPPQIEEARLPEQLGILLVEDHPDTAEMMSMALTRRGHHVTVARCADEALELLERGPAPDVMVSDLGLPDRSGLELIRTVRALHPRLPAVAVSGFGARRDVARSQEAGFDAHLTKPVSGRQLIGTLAEVLQHPRE